MTAKKTVKKTVVKYIVKNDDLGEFWPEPYDSLAEAKAGVEDSGDGDEVFLIFEVKEIAISPRYVQSRKWISK